MAARRKQKIKTTKVRGRSGFYGHIYHFPDRDIYLASRRLDQIFRCGEKNNSDAVRKEVACWAIDEMTLTELRLKGIVWVGVRVRQTQDIYITRIENFLNRNLSKHLDFSARGGAEQRYLPLKYFRVVPGKIKIR